MPTPEDLYASRVFGAYMTQALEKGDDGSGLFPIGHTTDFPNPNFAREGLPGLTSFQQMEENREYLLGVADKVIEEFITTPEIVQEEITEMSPALKAFLLDYPEQGSYHTRRMEPRPLHAESYRIGMQLAHRINRKAGLLPEIAPDDVDRIKDFEQGFGIFGSLLLESLSMTSDSRYDLLEKKIRGVSMELPTDQRKSLELAFTHLSSIIARKQRDML